METGKSICSGLSRRHKLIQLVVDEWFDEEIICYGKFCLAI